MFFGTPVIATALETGSEKEILYVRCLGCCGRNNTGMEVKVVGLSRGKSRAEMQSQQRPRLMAGRTVKLGWPFRTLSKGGKAARPSDPCVAWSRMHWPVRTALALHKAIPFGWAQVPEQDRAVRCCIQCPQGQGELVPPSWRGISVLSKYPLRTSIHLVRWGHNF